MIRDAEEARDLVQMAFVRLWEARDRYDSRYSPNTWIYRIATNLTIDYLRSRACQERIAEPFRLELLRGGEGAPPDLSRLEHREVERIFQELARRLSPRQRACFLLRELEGFSSAEVAEILGCDESTVRNHLFHARKELKKQLARRYPEYLPSRGGA
jgi:RNA polymerase sigma-70 factor (ECF subfamily)